jgi:hypothetical protein
MPRQVVLAQPLFFKRRGFRLGAKQACIAIAMRFAQRVLANQPATSPQAMRS